LKVLQLDIEDGYTIFPDGRVRGRSGAFLQPRVNSNGYTAVRLVRGWVPLHRLLAKAFVPNPDNLPQVNHIDGDKQNYALSNLEWCTHLQNLYHAMDTGLHPWGRCAVLAVRGGVSRRFASQAEAARATGAAQGNINRCLSGARQSAAGYIWRTA